MGNRTDLAELDDLTREYARYSRSAGGWSAVVGGLLGIASFVAGALSEQSTALRWVLVAVPFAWLLTRALMTRCYYQRLGRVNELTDSGERRVEGWLLAGVTVIVAVILLVSVTEPTAIATDANNEYSWLYLLILACIPVAGWLWLRTPLDLAVGVFLFCQAAVAAVGAQYPFASSATVVIPAALLMVGVGLRDQSRFRRLRRRIRVFQNSNGLVE